MDNSWFDREVIEALVENGITYSDFQKAGYENFAKSYFKEMGEKVGDEPER